MQTKKYDNSILLFEIIRAMSPSEQRQFQVSLSKKEGKDKPVTLAIYKSMQKLQRFDEGKYLKKLKKELSNDSQFQKLMERLSNEEAKLRDKIRRFLRDFNSKHYQHVQIKEMLIDVRLLIERGLNNQASQLIEIIREKAEAVGDTLALLEANREERTIAHARYPRASPTLNLAIERLVEERKRLLRQLTQEFDHQDVFDIFSVNIQAIRTKRLDVVPKPFRSQLDNLLNTPFSKNEDLSLFAEMRKWQVKCFLEYAISTESAPQHSEDMMKWWHDRPLYLKDQLYRYFISFNTFASAHVFADNHYEELGTVIKVVQETMSKLPVWDYIEFKHINAALFPLYLNARRLDDCLRMTQDLDAGLKNFVIPSATKVVLQYNMAIAYFFDGNFKEAALRFDQLQKADFTGLYYQIRYAVEMLGLISWFESSQIPKKNESEFIDLKYKWRKAHEFFQKQVEESNIYMKVLNYFNEVAFSNAIKQQKALKEWKAATEIYKNDNSARGLAEQTFWIESRLNGLPIRKVFTTSK